MKRVSSRSSRVQAKKWVFLFSCEHATNHIPKKWSSLFRNQTSVLKGHRGWDPGTLKLGRLFRKKMGAELIVASASRLLLEMNRSLGHPSFFSEFTCDLSSGEKQELIDQYWSPYRAHVTNFIEQAKARQERVLHISLHSFTPELNGNIRNADIGLLYDPCRTSEVAASKIWIETLRKIQPGLRLRKNYPYRGTADGLTTGMRKIFPDPVYTGIELEINQAFPLGKKPEWNRLLATLARSAMELLEDLNQAQ